MTDWSNYEGVKPIGWDNPESEDNIRYRIFAEEYKKRTGGLPFEHSRITGQQWLISKWDIDLPKPGNGFIKNIEKMWEERETKPLELEYNWNIITNVGLTESSRRDTQDAATTTTGVNYIQTGTAGASEDVSITDLVTPHGTRQAIDTIGERVTVNQTSKYGAVFDDTMITPATTVNEAGLFNAVSSGIIHAYVVFSNFTLNSGERIVFQINELQQNGTA
jgi:hypothetical protein